MRLDNWPQLLARKVEEWRDRPFVYGSQDCLQFPAECVLAITGLDYRDRFPQYESEMAAGRILVRCGGLDGLIISVLGKPKPVAAAQRGDVVAGDFGNGMTAFVCLGLQSAGVGPAGLVFRRTAEMQKAWSI
jgi:hypothetical protein